MGVSFDVQCLYNFTMIMSWETFHGRKATFRRKITSENLDPLVKDLDFTELMAMAEPRWAFSYNGKVSLTGSEWLITHLYMGPY